MIDFGQFTHLTFDCYGTLVNWEQGILDAVRPVLRRHQVSVSDEIVLRLYARLEAEQEYGPYKSYRDVLRGVMCGLAGELRFPASDADLDALHDSVGLWPPFADTVAALRRLAARYKLVILSNIDDALFARTASHLQVKFTDIITAQQVGSYKPSPENFRFALNRLGIPASQVLHVAQSLYHDHVPAKRLGFTTVWVNRPSRLAGTGLALPAEVQPDMEMPDLKSLADAVDMDAAERPQSSA